jgi:ComF family protein
MLPPVATPLCARCLVADRDPVGCLRHPGFSVRAAWVYDERGACLVHALKYGGRAGLAGALAEALETAIRGEPRPDLILAVPLHPARLRERGYNQAERLAAELSLRIGVPRLEGAIVRTRPTPPQARLGVVERRRNVADAFRVESPEVLDGRNVLIVDDVMTTGATLEACFVTLATAGAHARAAVLAWAS